MPGYIASVLLLASLGFSINSSASPQRMDLQLRIRELFELIHLMQVKSERPYLAPGLWHEKKGFYPAYFRLNFVGRPEVAGLREVISVFDNNMFATAWITTALLEAHLYAGAPRPSDQQIVLALESINQHQDRNVRHNNSIISFWPQTYDANASMWVSSPVNLLKSIQLLDKLPWNEMDKLLERLHMRDLQKFLDWIRHSMSDYMRSIGIPPDFDGTFVNMGLGSLLADMGADFSQPLVSWKGHNSNLSSVLEALRRYAYRPFSADQSVNTIDPRTYYYLRPFLHYAKASGLDVALAPTWVQSVTEARQYYYRGVVMPFQVNTIDVTVAANVVYGLTASVLSGLLPASVLDYQQEPEIAQIYHNTTVMIVSMINNGFFLRPDLALTYYPSVFQTYWFVARILHRMELALQKQALPKLMKELFPLLKAALEGVMTSHVTSTGTEAGEDMKYYDDFLGDGDVNFRNETKVKGEDRLYTTAMAVNALLTTWTLLNSTTNTVLWKPTTPDEVKVTAFKCVRWLSENILSLKYKPWNSFFSGSTKGNTTFPMDYPGNRLELLNGSRVYDYQRYPEGFFVYGVEGYIAETEYEALVQNKSAHFNHLTPTEFVSYNDPSWFFTFWSSPAYTYATSMLALGRYTSLQNNHAASQTSK